MHKNVIDRDVRASVKRCSSQTQPLTVQRVAAMDALGTAQVSV